MAFSRSLCSAILLYILASAQSEVSISDFSGVWRSYIEPSNVDVLTHDGSALVCRDTLSPGCEAEMTLSELTFTFNETTVAAELRGRVGIKTKEQSAEAHPECAKDGLYPVERIASLPPSQITCYNAKEEKMYFIDPRRPDDLNCWLLRYIARENGPHLEITYSELYKGSIPNLFALGISFRCGLLPKSCSVKITDQGELDLALQASFNMTCIAGDCLNVAKAAPPSPLYGTKESPVDI